MTRAVHLIGAPLGYGGAQAGAELGPAAVRIAGLHRAVERLGLGFVDRGDADVPRLEGAPGHPLTWRHPEVSAGQPKAWFLREIAEACADLRRRVEDTLDEGGLPLVVGGDHAVACGTIAGLSSWHARRDERIGLIWFDAHSDMNTPDTTTSGHVHGMPLAAVLGYGADELVRLGERVPMVDAANTVLVGIRDVDPGERPQLEASGIHVYTMRELDVLGMDRVMREAIDLARDGTAGFHLSFDLDGCDPVEAPGVGTPVRGGATHREAHVLMEDAAESGGLLGIELTEVNPVLDYCNRTAEFAVELILSALGKRVY